VLSKFYEDLVPDLPRMPYVDETSARATVEAMQVKGPPLPKVDVKALFDNSLLKGLENEGFVDRLSRGETPKENVINEFGRLLPGAFEESVFFMNKT
jgi:hypothetical protein